jgi:hypothetical protein
MVAADDVTTTYTHPQRAVYARLVLPALHALPQTTVAQAAGIPRRTIKGLRGGRHPDQRTLRQLVPALAKLCAADDCDIGDRDDLGVLAAWRDRQPTPRGCPACGAAPTDGRVYCRPAYRQAAYRQRLTRRLAE